MNFYSNGKLLLTAEYTVLDGAKALAIPTQYGQSLAVFSADEPIIQWQSLDENNSVWFECELEPKSLKLITSTFYSDDENPTENTAAMLQKILRAAQMLNPQFLADKNGLQISTKLTFPRNWGLGSSSTLINNIANWAQIDAYQLLKKTFDGSGYDLACAQKNTPILYQLKSQNPNIEAVDFNPSFKNQLYFIHLNQKQNSRDGIEHYRKYRGNLGNIILEISSITDEILKVSNLTDFEKLIAQHEQLIAQIIGQKPIQQSIFADYFGQIKSLGAWGGDFILATGNENTPDYFIKKGYQTVIPYHKMEIK